uniref:DUF4177 domain-containing protein n=1 Tax=viral metagenome TaxID=1070528 RepID=A0A6M3L778_9ZZZZ
MKVKVKVLYDKKYKSDEHVEKAIERWELKGWTVADCVYSFKEKTNATILYKEVSDGK